VGALGGRAIAVRWLASMLALGTLACGGGSGGQGGAGGSGGGSGSGGSAQVGTVGGCQIFPADNPWNEDVSGLPLSALGATYIANMAPTRGLHPDWGDAALGGTYYGIPFSSGTGAPPQVMNFDSYPDESDTAPCPNGGGQFCYPIPLDAPIEGGPNADTGSDRHLLYVDTAGAPGNCTLYELYNAQNPSGAGGWTAANGAIFHLGSDALRPDGWTSSDAAGLPVLPGLVGFDETVNKHAITHAIRFTMDSTQQGYIHPATHAAGSNDTTLPPMGLRLRLKASFDTSAFSGPMLVILTALKKYGLILADNGSNWYLTGESNDGWDAYMDDLVSGFGKVTGGDFEVVDTGAISTAGL
jgi:hypothetical protein